MLHKYINVQCDEYALLLDIRSVEEVIDLTLHADLESGIAWRGERVPFLDLTRILMGHQPKNNKHCIITINNSTSNDSASNDSSTNDGSRYLALGVGQVANIQSIKDNEFEDLPNLDFPFNDYFDKAYMVQQGKKCMYRLRNLAKSMQAKAG